MKVRWEIEKKAVRLAMELPKPRPETLTPTTESPTYVTD